MNFRDACGPEWRQNFACRCLRKCELVVPPLNAISVTVCPISASQDTELSHFVARNSHPALLASVRSESDCLRANVDRAHCPIRFESGNRVRISARERSWTSITEHRTQAGCWHSHENDKKQDNDIKSQPTELQIAVARARVSLSSDLGTSFAFLAIFSVLPHSFSRFPTPRLGLELGCRDSLSPVDAKLAGVNTGASIADRNGAAYIVLYSGALAIQTRTSKNK